MTMDPFNAEPGIIHDSLTPVINIKKKTPFSTRASDSGADMKRCRFATPDYPQAEERFAVVEPTCWLMKNEME